MNQQIKNEQVVGFMGRRGWGKSTACKQAQRPFKRIVVFDIMEEYQIDSRSTFIVTGFDEFAEKLMELENKKQFKIIFRFDAESLQIEEFDQALKLVYYVGDILVVVEEIHELSSVHKISPWLKKVILTGRHQGLTFFFTTQRPGELHKTILSQCAHLFIGSIFERNDVLYLSNILSPEKANMLKTLKQININSEGFPEKNEFLFWSPGFEAELIHVHFNK